MGRITWNVDEDSELTAMPETVYFITLLHHPSIYLHFRCKNFHTHKQKFQITDKKMQRSLIYLFIQTFYMFQAVPTPIIRST